LLQKKYSENIREVYESFFHKQEINHQNSVSYERKNMMPNNNNNAYSYIEASENEEVIMKINSGLIFKDIMFIFNVNTYDGLETNIKLLKQSYENKVDTLEKNMDYYKSYLENFYRRKIQKTRNTHMDGEFLNENLPIMKITSEHNEKLMMLRELYENKLKELENVSI
jgi:hypothetical protein